METVVGDISGAIQQHKSLSDVTLKYCSEELTRGVVEGLWSKQTPQYQVPESDGSLSLSVDTRYGRIEFKEQSLHVEGM